MKLAKNEGVRLPDRVFNGLPDWLQGDTPKAMPALHEA